MITIKNETQIEKMRKAGELLHSVLEALRTEIEPGVTTLHLDQMAEKLIRQAGAIPSFKGFEGFPYSICASVDDQVVHGFS
ncbi:MAG: M24 family metallopeptidase, partial [Clostridia bacterium]|nr:M24 family metallopeptidase [Clostridia bacterium]